MNIVIVGAGNVGRALGGGWLKTGHKVPMAVREPASSKAIELKKQGFGVAAAKEASRLRPPRHF
jgi:8-hydroxy-5-deazaflavin:NADPH oxidoreductase